MTGTKKALERFVVKWKFSKTRSDEMDLDEGDVVLVSAKFNDGWYKGIRLRGYKVGYFPADYVNKEPLVESNGIDINPPEQITESFCANDSHHSNFIPEDNEEPKELDLDSKRTKAAEEIVSTEISYCNGLNLVVEHFIQPMKIYGVLSLEEIDLIFSNVESLAGISKELVSKLKNRLEEWDVRKTEIGDVLLEMFNYLKMFKPYFDSRSGANRLRVRYEKSNERFRTFLSRVNCGHTLDSLLLMPIQRIPRYELLLKELVKRTDSDHPDYKNLSIALAKAQETASELNEHIRQIENESRIFEIIKMFPNDDLDLIISDARNSPRISPRRSPSPRSKRFRNSPTLPRKFKPNLEVEDTIRRSLSMTDLEKTVVAGSAMLHAPSDPSINHVGDAKSHIFRTRMFIHEGPVQKVIFKNNNTTALDSLGEQSDRYLILFSDIAIVAVEAGNVITGNKFKLKERINLSQCWVDEAEMFLKKPAPPEAFVLGTPKRMYIFLAPSVKDRTTWQKHILKRISIEKQKFVQYWRNKQVPDDVFVKTTVKPKVEYLSMNACELDLHVNEDVSVIGYRKGGLWIPGFYDATNSNSTSAISDWLPGVNNMGKFGWFPAECVPGNIWDSKEKCVDQFSFVSVAIALHIKQKMLEFTQSRIPLTFLSSVKVYRGDGTFRLYVTSMFQYYGSKSVAMASLFQYLVAIACCCQLVYGERKWENGGFFAKIRHRHNKTIIGFGFRMISRIIETCKLNETTTTEDIINHLDKHNRLCGLDIDKECIELWEQSKDGSVKRKHKQNEKIVEIISFWGEYQSQMSFVTHMRGMKESVETLLDSAIEVTIERRQSRGATPLKRPTGVEKKRQGVIVKSSSLPGKNNSDTCGNDN